MRDIMEVSLNSRYIKAADVVAIVEVAKIVRRRLRHRLRKLDWPKWSLSQRSWGSWSHAKGNKQFSATAISRMIVA
jgi:hypothetical protein